MPFDLVCREEGAVVDVDAVPLVFSLFNWTGAGVRGYHFDPLFDLETVRRLPPSWIVVGASGRRQKRQRQALRGQARAAVGSKPGKSTDSMTPFKAKAKVAKGSPANAVSPPKAKARLAGVLPAVPAFPTAPVAAAPASAVVGAEQPQQQEQQQEQRQQLKAATASGGIAASDPAVTVT